MADYYAILKRAIGGLAEPSGEARRTVYEKARAALVTQLKSFDPPLSASEITQQRLQLEDAIRKVEAEAAKGLLSQALSRVSTPDLPEPAATPAIQAVQARDPLSATGFAGEFERTIPRRTQVASPAVMGAASVAGALSGKVARPSPPEPGKRPQIDLTEALGVPSDAEPAPLPEAPVVPPLRIARPQPPQGQPIAAQRIPSAADRAPPERSRPDRSLPEPAQPAPPEFPDSSSDAAVGSGPNERQATVISTGGVVRRTPVTGLGAPAQSNVSRPARTVTGGMKLNPVPVSAQRPAAESPPSTAGLKRPPGVGPGMPAPPQPPSMPVPPPPPGTLPESEDVTRPVGGPPWKKAFEDIDRLGGAVAETAKRARDALAASDRPFDEGFGGGQRPEPPRVPEGNTRATRGRSTGPIERPQPAPVAPPTPPQPSRWPMIVGLVVAASVVALGATVLWMQRDTISAYLGTHKPLAEAASRAVGDKQVVKVTDRLVPDDGPGGKANAPGSVKVVTIQPITTTSDPAAPGNPGGQTDVAPSSAPTSPPQPKVADATLPAPLPPGEVPPITQRASLLEETGANISQPVVNTGKVVWQLAKEPSGQVGKPDVTRVKARIEIPDRKIVLLLTIEPNSDATLPASHLMKLDFKLPPDFDNKGVAKVPGVIMKPTEQSRGDPLASVSARLSSSSFWVALSSPEADKARNMSLLKDRGWIDIPFVYDNTRRAMLTIEKAGAGDRVINDALAAWANGG